MLKREREQQRIQYTFVYACVYKGNLSLLRSHKHTTELLLFSMLIRHYLDI